MRRRRLSPSRAKSLERARARLIGRICNDYFLDTVAVLSDTFNGDLVTGLVFLAIVRENTRGGELAPVQGAAPRPDHLRRPVTVYTVAKGLNLTYETARRHVNRLIKEGFCTRLDGGLIVAGEILARPQMTRALERNKTHFKRLLRDAADAGEHAAD